MTSKFDKRLDVILGVTEVGGSIDQQLDALEDEGAKESFDIVEYKQVDSAMAVVEGINQDALDDYKHSRNTIYGLIERGTSALEGALMVAKESEHPRAYEVASSIMKNISEMTKDLLELQKVLNPPKAGPKVIKADTINVQNNYGEGSQAELKDVLDGLEDE